MEKPIVPGLKTTFLVHLIVGLIFGLAYLLIPESLGNLLGWPVKDPLLERTVGAAILGFTASSWWAYREIAWEKVKIVVQMEIVWATLGALVALWGELFAGAPVAGWLNFIILGAFAVAFAYFYLQNTAAQSVSSQPAKSAR